MGIWFFFNSILHILRMLEKAKYIRHPKPLHILFTSNSFLLFLRNILLSCSLSILHSQCSRTCGKGWRKRTVLCKSFSSSRWDQILPDVACAAELKPKMQETCLLKRCYKNKKLQWFVSAWTEVRKLFLKKKIWIYNLFHSCKDNYGVLGALELGCFLQKFHYPNR